MQNNTSATNSGDVSLAHLEMSEHRPPNRWTRVSCGTLVYYRNEALHVTIDDATMMGMTASKEFTGFEPPDNLDIHLFQLKEREKRRDYVIFVYHDERIACKHPWPAPLPGPNLHVPSSPGAQVALGHHCSSLPYNPSDNGSEALPSNTKPLLPPADANVIDVCEKETTIDKQIRYWDYVRQHPGHVDVASFAHIVRDHLLWSRNERALSLGADPAFSHEECETLLRYLDAALLLPVAAQSAVQASAKARQTRLIAALMKRILKSERERQAQMCEKSRKPAETWLRWILYLVLIQVIFLGQPNTYSRRLARFKRGKPLSLDIHTKYWQAFLGAFIKEWNDTNLLATVMISATVGFLAVPGLDSISRILGIIAIIAAIGSGLVGMVYVWHHGPRANTNALVGREYIENGKSRAFGVRSTLLFACVLAVPVVLLWWSFLSFIAAVLVYAFRGQFLDAKDTPQDFSVATKYVALVAFVLVLDCGAVGYVFMWRVWQPINEPWAASTGDTRPDNAGPSEHDPE